MSETETIIGEVVLAPNKKLVSFNRDLEADLDYFIMLAHDELKKGSTPYSLLDSLFQKLEENEAILTEQLEAILTETTRDVVDLFRLRVKVTMLPEEVLWRAVASFCPENEEAKSLLLWTQGNLYGHYAAGIDYILANKAEGEQFTPEEEGMLQEMTTGALLTKEPHKNAAVFVSDASYDRAGIDLQLFHIQNNLLRTENIQVKTSDRYAGDSILHGHKNIITGKDTGNISVDENGQKNKTWQTAYAIWHDVHTKEKTDPTSVDAMHIKEILKYKSGKNVVGWLNDLGKR